MNDTTSLKAKIAGLLAKAERTDNEHERDAFNAKAEQLMIKYGIEQAELEAAGEVKPEEIIEVRIPFTGIYAVVMPDFVHTVARALGNLSVLQSTSWDKKTRTAFVIGHKSDVEAAQVLIASLQLQAQSAMKRWWKSFDDKAWMSNMEQYKARRQFIVSFSYGAADRIKSERRTEEATVSAGAALVLASKMDKVKDHVQTKYNPRASRGGVQGGMAGAAEGRSAGRQANVGTTGISGGRKSLNS